jgi:hypothetical protein
MDETNKQKNKKIAPAECHDQDTRQRRSFADSHGDDTHEREDFLKN